MKTFLVFEPANSGRDATSAERVMFVREKFYWLALLFAPLWLLWHRLWLGFFGWVLAEIVLGAATFALDLDPRAAAVVGLLPSLVVAFEGSELRRRKLLRRGRHREVAVVVGHDREDAERRFFAEWADGPRRETVSNDGQPPARPVAPVMPAPSNSVIGLFPEPGAGR